MYKISGWKLQEGGIKHPSLSIRSVPHGPDISTLISPLSQNEISSPSDADDDDVHFSSEQKVRIRSHLISQY